MRRRTLLVALAGLAVVVAAGVVALLPQPDRITQENYDRIQPTIDQIEVQSVFGLLVDGPRDGRTAMNREHVEAILGPPGDHRTGPTMVPVQSDLLTARPDLTTLVWEGDSLTTLVWEGDSAIISVQVRPSGLAYSKNLMQNKLAESTPIERLLWRIKRQWHRWFP
jgi:hypothetical protein